MLNVDYYIDTFNVLRFTGADNRLNYVVELGSNNLFTWYNIRTNIYVPLIRLLSFFSSSAYISLVFPYLF